MDKAVIDQLAQDAVMAMAYEQIELAQRMIDRYLDKIYADRTLSGIDPAESLTNEQDMGFTFLTSYNPRTDMGRSYHDTVEAISEAMNRYIGVIP